MSSPLVSVLTPLDNGAKHLAECIESVLAQTYSNWEYTIVDNCSTDDSRAIAQKYADRDPRIHVVTNDRYLSVIENYNQAISQMSPESRYCKMVFADDWIYPGCIEEMVRVAECHPSVGLVGGYTTDGRAVLWQAPAHPANPIPGRSVCRSILLGGPYVLGSMTSLLVRSDLVRKNLPLLDEQNPHREVAACFNVLRESDYGYVHQVLSFSRPRTGSAERFAKDFRTCAVGSVAICLKYGPAFLSHAEYQQRWKEVRWNYHRILASNLLRRRPAQFWKFHAATLAVFGGKINRQLLAACAILMVVGCLSKPLHTIRDFLRWCRTISAPSQDQYGALIIYLMLGLCSRFSVLDFFWSA
jgi:glycosyltransferase involved in cell wall biosynthesis